MFDVIKPCPCGSGEPSEWEYDARGYELGRMCEACRSEKLAGFRPEVLTDTSYEADEAFEPDGVWEAEEAEGDWALL